MKNPITRLLAILFTLTLFTRCTQEETILSDTVEETLEPIQLTEQEIIISNFNLNGLDDSTGIKKDNMKVLWDKHKTISLDGRDWYEFGIEELTKPDLEEGEVTDITYSLLTTLTDETPAYWLVRMDSHNGEPQQSYFQLEDKVFTGMTYLFDMKGTISMARYYEKGEAFNGISDKDNPLELPAPLAARRCDAKLTARDCSSASGCPPPTNGNNGCKGGGGRYIWQVSYSFTDWYMDRNGDGRGQASEYSHTTRQETRSYVWVSSGSSAAPSQNSWSYTGLDGYGRPRSIPRPSISPERIVKHPSLKSFPCVGKILSELARGDFKQLRLNKLGQLEGGKHLSKTILDLFENNSKHHLNIKVGTLSNANGSTKIVRNMPSRGQITFEITLDKRFVQNGTKLVIARTLIHESLHAYLSYLYQNRATSSFSSLLRHYLSQNGYNNNAAQHRLMTEFADAIGHSLSVWDNNKLSIQYYRDLGWSGDMLQTNEYKALSTSRQASIRNANIAEGSALQNASNKAKGEKCK